MQHFKKTLIRSVARVRTRRPIDYILHSVHLAMYKIKIYNVYDEIRNIVFNRSP